MQHRIVIVTGVSGSGKTTVGSALAVRLDAEFHDGDEFHPVENKQKMGSGIPLTDEDREPWLGSINSFIHDRSKHVPLVIACSALKEKYRQKLSSGLQPSVLYWVHLQGDYELIHERMMNRKDHYMKSGMLRSQFETYEPPTTGIFISIDKDREQIIDQILQQMQAEVSDIGLIGLGVMGTSLARNIASKGFSISIYNRHVTGKEEAVAVKMKEMYPELSAAFPYDDLQHFIESLKRPRKIILMVNAGAAVDDVILNLEPLLGKGDVIIDGGNSYFKDTDTREKKLAEVGIHFVGTGISGGEEGALKGPSIMPGGSVEGWLSAKNILQAIAARNELNEVCCDHIGKGGAGHFVKMVHNGIEYAEMQLITECYAHLRYDQHKSVDEIAAIFETWNKGDGASYLLGITVDILRFRDQDGSPLLDKISDVAGNKGTGSWTAISAAQLGIPVPAMAEALFARYISSFKDQRANYSEIYVKSGEALSLDPEHVFKAYLFARIINHHQGMDLIRDASANYGWDIDTSALLRIWSGGCIIRSSLLALLREGWSAEADAVLAQTYCQGFINENYEQIKSTISRMLMSDRGYPVLSSCLEYFKLISQHRNASYLLQAQRDYFGAHTYQRIDDASGKPHHTNWY